MGIQVKPMPDCLLVYCFGDCYPWRMKKRLDLERWEKDKTTAQLPSRWEGPEGAFGFRKETTGLENLGYQRTKRVDG